MANILDISLNISMEMPYALKAINILAVHLPPLHSD